jgi:hypothetical protein
MPDGIFTSFGFCLPSSLQGTADILEAEQKAKVGFGTVLRREASMRHSSGGIQDGMVSLAEIGLVFVG